MIVNEVFVAEKVNHVLPVLQHPLGPGTHDALNPGNHPLDVMVEEKDVFSP